ncbi:MAG TPA: succinyl-diaminopimelate desuccinylase [Stellaceae bacterium]|nr:succinyl-diaminopimelate desuccinylase [Stellaceae bacterium]
MTAEGKIDPVDPVALAAELIRCPSVTPADAGAIEVLTRALERLGFTCTKLEFAEPGTEPVLNLYARLGNAGRNFCYAGHTDVVPVGRRESWTVDPFGGEIIDGTLYGRGASDMKGGIAAFVSGVARFLAARGGSLAGSISLLITGDEEGVSINGTKKVLEWLAAKGEKLDVCIVGEPTSAKRLGDMVKVGRRGSMTGTLVVKGVQGHTAYPQLADNPIHRMVRMLHALTREPLDNGSEHFQPSTLQITTTDVGNPASNVIPGEARAVFNIRFNDRWTSATLDGWARERIGEAGGEYDLRWSVSGESFLTPPAAVSELLSRAIKQVTGLTPELSTTGGTSDARFIVRHCPVAEFGLVGQTMHKVDERVPVADLGTLAEIYRAALDLYFPAA